MVIVIRPLNEALRARILDAGKEEFFRHGFSKATIRNIATRAGVTTGAIYIYFQDKTALFDALVSSPAQEMLRQAAAGAARMDAEMRRDPAQYGKWLQEPPDMFIEYVYEHFDAFKLLACHAGGTSYGKFIDDMVDIETQSTIRFIEYLRDAGILKREIDDEFVHITASTHFAGMFEPIAHDMDREQALRQVRMLNEFYAAGWKKILGA